MTTIQQFGKVIAGAAISIALMASGNARANDDAVRAFYDFLSNPGSQTHADAFLAATGKQWESLGDYSGRTKSREQFVAQLGGFAKLIPDMNWAIEEVLRDGNRVIVRGRATGTPKGPLFGVDGKGKGFEIMSIDIHTIENERIIRSYHVEDWAGALRQLRGR